MDREPFNTPKSSEVESRRLLSMLMIGSVVVAALIVWTVVQAMGAPFIVGVFVALLFLCMDAIAIAIVWYGSRRR